MAQNSIFHSKTLSEMVDTQMHNVEFYKSSYKYGTSQPHETPNFHSSYYKNSANMRNMPISFSEMAKTAGVKDYFPHSNFADYRKTLLSKIDSERIQSSYSQLRDILKDATSSFDIASFRKPLSPKDQEKYKIEMLCTPPDKRVMRPSLLKEDKLNMLKNLADQEAISQSQNTDEETELEQSIDEPLKLTESIAINPANSHKSMNYMAAPVVTLHDYVNNQKSEKTATKIALKHSATANLDKHLTPKFIPEKKDEQQQKNKQLSSENQDLRVMLEALMRQMETNAKETAELKEVMKLAPKEQPNNNIEKGDFFDSYLKRYFCDKPT